MSELSKSRFLSTLVTLALLTSSAAVAATPSVIQIPDINDPEFALASTPTAVAAPLSNPAAVKSPAVIPAGDPFECADPVQALTLASPPAAIPAPQAPSAPTPAVPDAPPQSPIILRSTITKTLSPPVAELEKLTDEIIYKEIDLLKINNFFRLENGKNSPGKFYRTLFYKHMNYIGTFGGMLENVVYNFYWEHNAKHVTLAPQWGATVPRLVGKAILIGGVAFEASIEAVEQLKEWHHGLDVHSTDRRVLALSTEIKGLIDKRDRLIAQGFGMTPAEQAMASLDTPMLKEGLTQGLQEYGRMHSRAIEKQVENRLTNFLTEAKKSDGCFGSDVTRVNGAYYHQSKAGAAASISTCISGYMAVLNPLIEIEARKLSHKWAERSITKKLQIDPVDVRKQFKEDSARVLAATAKLDLSQQPILAKLVERRADIYHGEAQAVSTMDYVDNSEMRRQHKADFHSVFIHCISGGSKAARGTALIYVGLRYYKHPNHNSLLTAVWGVPYMIGSGIRMLDLDLTTAKEVAFHKRYQARRSVPGIMLRARLDSLEHMQDRLERNMQLVSGS